ncbi:hypothetical protein GALL_324130 [mine drainage metagenome]|uniref:MarR family protein n=1 Tax=mine drainage metagenome TaxID=410659 RepID=A0A1J5QQ74_9ZZZZ
MLHHGVLGAVVDARPGVQAFRGVTVPFLSLADVGYVAFYVAMLTSVVLTGRRELAGSTSSALLDARPGLSITELAREVCLTRRSTSFLLRGLDERGLVTRPATASRGRELPTKPTSTARDDLEAASTAMLAVRTTTCAAPAAEDAWATAQSEARGGSRLTEPEHPVHRA